jgi:hypothetical protein
VLHDDLLYHGNKLCVSGSFVRLLFLQEGHRGGLMGHYRVKKTNVVMAAYFFWPKMRHNVEPMCHGALLAIKLSLNLTHMSLYASSCS